MDISRISAIVLALLAAILVIVAGKSCTDDIESSNRRTRLKNKAASIATTAPDTAPPVVQTAPQTEPTTEAPTLPYDIVTNMLGDIVETIPKPTNEFGEIETTESTETKSILEQYEELHQTTVPITEQAETQEEATTKYIEPAKDIVIQLG